MAKKIIILVLILGSFFAGYFVSRIPGAEALNVALERIDELEKRLGIAQEGLSRSQKLVDDLTRDNKLAQSTIDRVTKQLRDSQASLDGLRNEIERGISGITTGLERVASIEEGLNRIEDFAQWLETLYITVRK